MAVANMDVYFVCLIFILPIVSGTSYLEYTGTCSYTINNKTCQRWDSQTPHSHPNTDPRLYPSGSLEAAANYCRDPDNSGFLWCYTTDLRIRYEKCDLKTCPLNKKEGCTGEPVVNICNNSSISVPTVYIGMNKTSSSQEEPCVCHVMSTNVKTDINVTYTTSDDDVNAGLNFQFCGQSFTNQSTKATCSISKGSAKALVFNSSGIDLTTAAACLSVSSSVPLNVTCYASGEAPTIPSSPTTTPTSGGPSPRLTTSSGAKVMTDTPEAADSTNTAAITIGVVTGVILLTVIVIVALVVRYKARNKQRPHSHMSEEDTSGANQEEDLTYEMRPNPLYNTKPARIMESPASVYANVVKTPSKRIKGIRGHTNSAYVNHGDIIRGGSMKNSNRKVDDSHTPSPPPGPPPADPPAETDDLTYSDFSAYSAFDDKNIDIYDDTVLDNVYDPGDKVREASRCMDGSNSTERTQHRDEYQNAGEVDRARGTIQRTNYCDVEFVNNDANGVDDNVYNNEIIQADVITGASNAGGRYEDDFPVYAQVVKPRK